MKWAKERFGKTKDGEEAFLYTIANRAGMQVRVSDFGATLVSVTVRDKTGRKVDVVQGYDNVQGYEEDTLFMGAVVGRCANRIGGASFVLNGQLYGLSKNDGDNCLHSGRDFYKGRIWNLEEMGEEEIRFSLFSPHMDQGFPGDVLIHVAYRLTEEGELQIIYEASPKEDTVINMTNHSYFNLDGHDAGSVLGQKVWIDADMYMRNDENSIPTGEILSVEGTPLDFRTAKSLGRDIESGHEALRLGAGYDIHYVVNGSGYREAASIESEKSGIKMRVFTDCPGMQLYTANFLAGERGKGGASYQRRSSVCFETQYAPDAVHHADFESPVCKKGETYCKKTGYRFSIIE